MLIASEGILSLKFRHMIPHNKTIHIKLIICTAERRKRREIYDEDFNEVEVLKLGRRCEAVKQRGDGKKTRQIIQPKFLLHLHSPRRESSR